MSNRHQISNSSAISHIDYEDDKQIMEVGFTSGSAHKFENVPRSVYDGMKEAKSAGGYFHANLRGKFKEIR